MGKFLKQLTAAAFSLILTVAGLVPLTRVYATEYGTGDYGLTVGVDENQDWVADLTVNGVQWTSDADEFLTSDGKYNLSIELHVPNESLKDITSVRTSGDVSEYFDIWLAGNPEYPNDGETKFTYNANFNMPSAAHSRLSLFPYSEESQGGEEPVEGDTEAHLSVTCTDTGDPISCYDVSFAIGEAPYPSPYQGNEEIVIDYNSEEEVFKEEVGRLIPLHIYTLWHEKITSLSINDLDFVISDYINYNDQASYLEHYGHQLLDIIFFVPKAANDIYDIDMSIDYGSNEYVGNFLWTADPAQKDSEDYIGNSSLSLVEISFVLGDIKYSCNADTGDCSESDAETGEKYLGCNLYEDESCGIPYVEFDTDDELGFEEGSLVIPAGARITMRVIPDYGYQVLNVNMADLITNDEGVGEFTFTVPGGAAYFVADVVEMDDEFETNSEKVAAGTIDLGSDQTSLSHGTARLEVEDIELTDENKEKFADVVFEDGYDIKTYLDISLYNIIYKGTEEDAWSEQVKDLNEPATVTLQLEEGVDGNEVVIVHQKHDGTYEVIPTTYDPETNTITFTTSSFSNYAIASRTVATPDTGSFTRESSHVKEGASVAAFILMLGFALVSRKKFATRK